MKTALPWMNDTVLRKGVKMLVFARVGLRQVSGILFVVLIAACNPDRESSKGDLSITTLKDRLPPITYSSTEQILEYCYVRRNSVEFDDACQVLYDSLLIEGHYPYYFFDIIHIVPELNAVDWNLLYEKSIPPVNSHHMMQLTIRPNGLMIIEDQRAEKDTNGLGQSLNAYLADSLDLPELRPREIDHFGKVTPVAKGFRISVMVEHDSLSISSCKTLIRVVSKIRSIYEDKRNEISLSKWDKGFESLSIDEKVAVTEVANLHMMVVFERP